MNSYIVNSLAMTIAICPYEYCRIIMILIKCLNLATIARMADLLLSPLSIFTHVMNYKAVFITEWGDIVPFFFFFFCFVFLLFFSLFFFLSFFFFFWGGGGGRDFEFYSSTINAIILSNHGIIIFT